LPQVPESPPVFSRLRENTSFITVLTISGISFAREKTGEHEINKGDLMQLKAIMTYGVDVIPSDATVKEAAEKMKKLDVGPLPVCDGERLVGILTDRDITIRAVAEGRDPFTTKVCDVMTPEIVYCFEDQDVKDAAILMEEKQIRRLPTLNRNKWIVGIVSLGDLAVGTGVAFSTNWGSVECCQE
jgi:CBS domain-containing protein